MQSYSCRIFQQRFSFSNIFSIDLILLPSKHFNITRSVSRLPGQFRKHRLSKQLPLRWRYLKFWGWGENLTWGDLAFYEVLENPLETMFRNERCCFWDTVACSMWFSVVFHFILEYRRSYRSNCTRKHKISWQIEAWSSKE